MHLKFYILLS